MSQASDVEIADKLTRRRARMLPVLAIIFITQQGSYFADGAGDGGRMVDHVKVSAWLILSAILLLALTTGGFWFRSAKVRALMNDEVTAANRSEAFRVGFLATMIGGGALYVLNMFEPIAGREAIHLLMTIGLAAALVRFGFAERRSLKDG